MALNEAKENDGIVFLGLYDGYIKRNVSEDTEGAKKRITSSGKTVYEKFYRDISGHLIKLEKKHHEEYGEFWNIYLEDQEIDEIYCFQIPYSSRQSDGFLRRLPNVDFKLPIVIKCGKYDEKPYLTISQSGAKVEYWWTQENPGKLPPMEKLVVKGKEVWDDTKKMYYLENFVYSRVIPQLELLNPVENLHPSSEPIPKKEKDDLPF